MFNLFGLYLVDVVSFTMLQYYVKQSTKLTII